MSTINDLELAELVQKIHRWNAHLDRQMANGKEADLFRSLMEMEAAARNAQARLNALKYGKDFVPPVEQMGT